jgi:hypothetical protein
MTSQIAFVIPAVFLVYFVAKATAKVANDKGGNPRLWFLAGVLLPGVALVIALFIDAQSTKECPRCVRRVDPNARICGYCGHDFARDQVVPE